jgi:hypothetical protein
MRQSSPCVKVVYRARVLVAVSMCERMLRVRVCLYVRVCVRVLFFR